MREDFAVFICTHGRPNKQLTLNTLRNCGYTGKIYLVLDDTDSTIQQYIDIYGTDNILVFDKNYFINTCYKGSSENVYKCILYAKAAVEFIAKDMGLKSFVIADDDIIKFRFRYIENNKLCSTPVSNLNGVLDLYIDYLLDSNITTLGFGTVHTYIGGIKGLTAYNLTNRRFTYNFILRNAEKPVTWYSEMNEDSITPVLMGLSGQVWLQLPFVQLDMLPCRAGSSGGMSEVYSSMTEFKQFSYFILHTPSCVSLLKRYGKYTHAFDRNKTFVKIISDKFKKE